MASILVATGFVRIESDTKPALKALKAFGGIAGNALTVGLLPATAAATTAILGIGSAAAVAGGAAVAFGAAVVPQFQDITKAMQQQTVAEDAKTKAAVNASIAQDLAKQNGFKYGEQVKITAGMTEKAKAAALEYNTALSASKTASKSATQAQALYKQKLDSMPKATRDTAEALQKLKDDTNEWSRSLSSSTMPIFTRGIEGLRNLLPKLTPIVKDVSREISAFTSTLGEGTAGKVFREFGSNITKNGAGALRTFLEVGKNLTVGVLGILNAFMPMQKQMSGGLQELTRRFAEWGAGLGKSKGFQTFVRTAQDAGPRLSEAFSAITRALGDISSAAGPLAGIGLRVITIFARIIDAIPTPVLKLLVPVILATNLAFKLYAIYTAIATAATWAFSSSAGASRASMLLLRIGMAAYWVQLRLMSLWTGVVTAATWALSAAMLVAGSPITLVVVAIAALAAVFIIAWKKSETFRSIVKGALNGVIEAGKAVGRWFSGPFVDFFTKTIPHAFQATIDWIKSNWPYIVGALGGPVGVAVAWIVKHWDKVKSALSTALDSVIDFFKKLPGRITGALGGLGKLLGGAGSDLIRGLLGGALRIASSIGSWLKSHILDPIVNGVKRMFGISSPSTVMARLGMDIIRGLLAGALRIASSIGSWLNRNVFTPMTRFFVRAGVWLLTSGRNIISGLLSGARARWDAVGDWLRGRAASVRAFIGNAAVYLFSKGRDIISGLLSGLKDKWSDAVGWIRGLKDKVVSAIKSAFGIHSPARAMIPLGVNIMAGLMKGILSSNSILKSAVKSIFGSLSDVLSRGGSLVGDLIGDLGESIGLGTSKGVNRFKPIVALALRMLGQPIGLMGTVLRRMNQESGGNPSVVNKWDSNWQRGTPSVGLMQVIGPTFRAYAGKYRNKGPKLYGVSIDPLANIYASMRYAIARYGSLSAAYNRPGGYRLGTAGSTAGWHWVGENGAELMRLPAGVQVKNHRDSVRSASGASIVIEKLVLENHGVIGSKLELENWLVSSLDTLRKKGRIK